MRILLLVCFLLGEIHADGRASEATGIKSKAETALLEGHEKLIDAYRIQLAAAVAKADHVEVFQLDDRVTGNEKIGDPNDPFSGQSKDKWFRVDVPETPTTKIAVKLIVPQEKLGPLILTTSPNSGAKEDLITKRAVEFAETDLESASLAESSEPIPEQRGKKTKGNSTAIQIRLTEVAGKKMEQFSEKNLGKQIAILVDHEIVMAPTIQTIMGRNLMISGNFSPEEAKRMIGKPKNVS